MEETKADALAYLDFPYVHHRRLRINNVQKWLYRKFEHRRVMRVFFSRGSLARMLGAVFAETDEDWAAKRWFTEK